MNMIPARPIDTFQASDIEPTSDPAINDIIQSTRGNIEDTGVFEIEKKEGIIANTIGHIGAIPTHLILGTWKDLFKKTDVDNLESFIHEKFSNVSLKGNVMVRLGHNNVFKEVWRLFKPGIKNRPNIFYRGTFGLVTTLAMSLNSSWSRANYYNPFTKSAIIYHPNPAIAAHEIGHAIDFDQKNMPGIHSFLYRFWPFKLKREHQASRIAMQHLNSEERSEAIKVLEPAFMTYVGGALGALASVLSPSRILSVPLALGSLLAGHIDSRINNRRKGDYNMFFNKDVHRSYA